MVSCCFSHVECVDLFFGKPLPKKEKQTERREEHSRGHFICVDLVTNFRSGVGALYSAFVACCVVSEAVQYILACMFCTEQIVQLRYVEE